MEHKMIDSGWKSLEELNKLIKKHEPDGWSVAAMGDIFDEDILVMVKFNDTPANHKVIPVDVNSMMELKMVIAEKIAEGYEICAIGECSGKPMIVVKKNS